VAELWCFGAAAAAAAAAVAAAPLMWGIATCVCVCVCGGDVGDRHLCVCVCVWGGGGFAVFEQLLWGAGQVHSLPAPVSFVPSPSSPGGHAGARDPTAPLFR
jgi:hypothetical protein